MLSERENKELDRPLTVWRFPLYISGPVKHNSEVMPLKKKENVEDKRRRERLRRWRRGTEDGY